MLNSTTHNAKRTPPTTHRRSETNPEFSKGISICHRCNEEVLLRLNLYHVDDIAAAKVSEKDRLGSAVISLRELWNGSSVEVPLMHRKNHQLNQDLVANQASVRISYTMVPVMDFLLVPVARGLDYSAQSWQSHNDYSFLSTPSPGSRRDRVSEEFHQRSLLKQAVSFSPNLNRPRHLKFVVQCR